MTTTATDSLSPSAGGSYSLDPASGTLTRVAGPALGDMPVAAEAAPANHDTPDTPDTPQE